MECMSMDKNDYLRDCMSGFGTIPLDSFTQGYCLVCANRECTRSYANTMVFDKRVQNWHKTLFSEVPRADANDPRYENVRAKRFIPKEPLIQINTPTQVTSIPIIEPTMNASQPNILEAPPCSPPVPPPDAIRVQTIPKAPIQEIKIREQATATEPQTKENVVDIPQGNTPFQQGQVIKSDAQPEKSDVIMTPGGTFTFGD